MVNIKQRERIDKEGTPDDNIFVVPLQKNRKQELEDRRRQKDMESVADIKDIVAKHNMSLVRSEEHLPSGDAGTTTSDELRKQKERYYNRRSGNSFHIH